MEPETPPRPVPGEAAFRYIWDKNGAVKKIERAAKPKSDHASSRASVQRSLHHRHRSSCFSDEIESHTALAVPLSFHRPISWRPQTPADRALIPDYVANFLRGETPETLARRRRTTRTPRTAHRKNGRARSQSDSSVSTSTSFSISQPSRSVGWPLPERPPTALGFASVSSLSSLGAIQETPFDVQRYSMAAEVSSVSTDDYYESSGYIAAYNFCAADATDGCRTAILHVDDTGHDDPHAINVNNLRDSDLRADHLHANNLAAEERCGRCCMPAPTELLTPCGPPPGEADEEADRLSLPEDEKKAPDEPMPSGKFPGSIERFLVSGWRTGVAANMVLALMPLLLLLLGLILAVSMFNSQTGKAIGSTAESVVYAGPCATSAKVGWALFAVVNVFAVVLLGGANYVFQLLSSPTREEVDRAHADSEWLDIGVPSFRNLLSVSTKRAFPAVFVLMTAVASQVIYNSLISISHATLAHEIIFINPSSLSADPFGNDMAVAGAASLSPVDIISRDIDVAARPTRLANLTPPACLEAFSGPFQTEFTTVFLLVDVESPGVDGSVLQTAPRGSSLAPFADPGGDGIILGDRPVTGCLAIADLPISPTECAVSINLALMGMLTLLSLFAVLTLLSVMSMSRFEPLATLGDALASFIEYPDETTRGICLLTKQDVLQRRWQPCEPKHWFPTRIFWYSTVSVPQRITWALAWLLLAVPAAIILGQSLGETATTTPAKPLSGLGAASARVVYALPPSFSRAAGAVVAALPHLALAGLYLATNATLTTALLSREASRFALPWQREPLRVSSGRPRGSQTAALYLTLPRPYSWFLLVLFALAAFFLSQSLAVAAAYYPLEMVSERDASLSSPPPPPVGVVIGGGGVVGLIVCLLVLGLFMVAMAFRGIDAADGSGPWGRGGNLMVLEGGSCSAVLSARCHRITVIGWGGSGSDLGRVGGVGGGLGEVEEDYDDEERAVEGGNGGQRRASGGDGGDGGSGAKTGSWWMTERASDLVRGQVAFGVLEEGEGTGPGRVGFTMGPVGVPVPGRSYA